MLAQVLALEGPRPVDGYGTSGQPVDALISWPYVNKSRMYYDSSEYDPVPLTEHELALQVQVRAGFLGFAPVHTS